jgi:hypothetical protein
VGGRKGKSARPRGRPQQTARIRAAQDLRARGRTLRQIAESELMRSPFKFRVTHGVEALHPRRRLVTPQGVAYLLRQTPRLDRWQRDLDQVAVWCRGLESDEFNEFWQDVVFPLLLTHPDLVRGRSAQEETFTAWTVTDGRRVKTRSKPWWWARHADLEDIEKRARAWADPREWRRAVRATLVRHLWERRSGPPMWRRLSEVADRVGLSARQVRRILNAERTAARLAAPEPGRPGADALVRRRDTVPRRRGRPPGRVDVRPDAPAVSRPPPGRSGG